jgi:hypothetical protein
MLLNNGSFFGRVKAVGGYLKANNLSANARRQLLKENFNAFGQYTSVPQGYQDARKAYIPTLKESSFIRAVLTGVGALVNTGIQIPVAMSATVTGEGTLTPDAEVGKTLAATVVGTGNLSGDTRMIVSLAATVDAGARPSAFDIMQEVWQAKAAGFPDPTTMGGKVNAAGTAGDPWSADLSSYPPGTAGNILYSMDPQALADAIMNDPKMLTVAKFLGLK